LFVIYLYVFLPFPSFIRSYFLSRLPLFWRGSLWRGFVPPSLSTVSFCLSFSVRRIDFVLDLSRKQLLSPENSISTRAFALVPLMRFDFFDVFARILFQSFPVARPMELTSVAPGGDLLLQFPHHDQCFIFPTC